MGLAEVYSALGEQATSQLAQLISIGATRTFGVYETIKIRSRLRKFNRQKLRKAAPALWRRIDDGDGDLAREFTEAVLVSNIGFIVEALDLLGIEHDANGFLKKDTDYTDKFLPGWESKLVDEFDGRYPEVLILLYINYLGTEGGSLDSPFLGASAEQAGLKPA